MASNVVVVFVFVVCWRLNFFSGQVVVFFFLLPTQRQWNWRQKSKGKWHLFGKKVYFYNKKYIEWCGEGMTDHHHHHHSQCR